MLFCFEFEKKKLRFRLNFNTLIYLNPKILYSFVEFLTMSCNNYLFNFILVNINLSFGIIVK